MPGHANFGGTSLFSWMTIPQGQGYIVVVGTARFGTDLLNSGIFPGGTGSYLPRSSLPYGRPLYATLLTKTSGSWTRFQAITFSP